MVPAFMDSGCGKAIAEITVLGAIKLEHIAWRAVDPVVIGEAQQTKLPAQVICRGVEGKNTSDTIICPIIRDIVGTVQVKEAEQLGEWRPKLVPAVCTGIQLGKDPERPLGVGIDGIGV